MIEIITQKQLVPHVTLNGVTARRDSGFALAWVHDLSTTPPKVMKSGLVPSGAMETLVPNAAVHNADGGSGEIDPILRGPREEREATFVLAD